MSQPIKVVVVVVVVLVKIRSIIAETTLSSIVSQPISVDVFVFVVDAEAVVVVDDFVAIQKLAIKIGQNRVKNS